MNQRSAPILRPRPAALRRAGLIAAGLAALTFAGACAADPSPSTADVPVAEQLSGSPTPGPDSTDPASTDPTATADATTPAVTTKTVAVRKSIGYSTKKVDDDSLAEGKTRVRTKGAAGVRTLTYEVTLTGGKETGRKLVSDVVTKKPVTKVVAVGTKQDSGGCDPNYTPCVPIASDVDCAGGSGNGPAYVTGPIKVIGDDHYDLDRDGDGIACDN